MSNSRSNPKAVVIGDHWKALHLSLLLEERGVETTTLLSEEAPHGIELTYLGNGEERPIAERIYGDVLARSFWDLSQSNLAYTLELLSRFGVSHERGKVARGPGKEPAVTWDGKELLMALRSKQDRVWGATPTRVQAAISRVEVEWEKGSVRGDFALLCTSRFDLAQFPWLEDRWLPVTLTSFYGRGESGPWTLPNGGADYRVSLGERFRVGSFRSLQRDDRVGIHQECDALSEKGVRKGFGVEGELDWENHVEGVTCDGLPLVGSVPDSPALFLCGGFNGRDANFWFSAAAQLVEGVLGDGRLGDLSFASTRRFI